MADLPDPRTRREPTTVDRDGCRLARRALNRDEALEVLKQLEDTLIEIRRLRAS